MRPGSLFIFAAVVSVLIAACQKPAGVADDLGRRVVLPANIARIVTIAPNVTELVAAAGAGERIVGIDDFSNYPPSVRNLPRVGGLQPSIEMIVRLRPDLVIASSSGNQAAIAPALSGAGIPLFVVKTDRAEDVPRAIRRLGGILRAHRAEAAARNVERELSASRRVRAFRPRVLFLVWPDPVYVAGRETFLDDLLVLCGAQNAVPGNVTGWPQYSMETVLQNPPDIILFPSNSVPRASLATLFEKDESWRQLACVRRGDYFAVDEDVFTRPGPRVVEAARELNALLDGVTAR